MVDFNLHIVLGSFSSPIHPKQPELFSFFIYWWLFQVDDEPILYIGNGWKSPNFHPIFFTGWLSGTRNVCVQTPRDR